MRKALLTLMVVATVATGCRPGASDPSAGRDPTTGPTAGRARPDCPNQDSATSGPRTQGSLSGDVDGDGSRDTLYLAVDPTGPEGCRAFVVAGTGAGRLAEEISDPDISFDLGLPTLENVAPVDARDGDEIVVRILAGASTLFVGLFTVFEGELARIEVAGDSQYGNLFPSGGSVGHIEGTDCSEDGIVISLAVPEGKGYEVTRTFYSVSATVAEPTHTQRGIVRPRNLNRYPELGGSPFTNCPPHG